MDLHVSEHLISDIIIPKRALKQHPERQVAQIVKSIEAFGFNDPVAIDESGEIIEGVGRVLAARQLGFETLPVIRLEHLNQAQKKAYRLAHNKISLNTGFDLDALREEFLALSALDEALLEITGFEAVEIEDLLKTPALPDLEEELTEALENRKKVTCPGCGVSFHV